MRFKLTCPSHAGRLLLASLWLLVAGCAHQPGLQSSQSGQASYYAAHYQGKQTAGGQRFDHRELTAAHRSLPFGTRLKVTHQHASHSVIVTVTDRGPYVPGRVVDLTRTAFRMLAPLDQGLVPVTIEVVEPD